MSAWPEAMYIIDKINESFKLVETFKEQIETINEKTNDIAELENRTNAHDTEVQELDAQLETLRSEVSEAIHDWENYSDSDLVNLGDKVDEIETLVKSQERQIAFVATKDDSGGGPDGITNASAYSVWFIQE